MTIAEIIIARGIATTYSYLIPETLKDQITIGSPVTIPLGRTKCAGTVIKTNKKTPQNIQKKLKPILEIDSKRPILPPKSIDLINWFSHFYQTTPFKALQTIIGNRKYRPLNDPPKTPEFTTPFTLTPSQNNAIATILTHQEKNEFLLHGVTGSGKTEIYIQLAAAMQQKNQQTLILVPEIALTPQYMTLFTQRFGEKLSIIHSGLTPKNRDIAWNKINQNHSDIIIGPRSAIFTPIQRLGLIIIDEEHDPSYKQDTFPRYDIHHIASFLAKQHNAKILLGSATPRLTTLHRHLNQASYIQLTDRATGVPLPKVHIIDMTNNEFPPGTVITTPLKNAIQTALSQNEKVMILINRRGYAPTIICQSCQKYLTCPECQLSYTYHQNKQLRCHRCDTTIAVTNTCPHCQKNTLQFSGLGIQKVELELNKQFNNATIIRLDKDTAKNAKDIDQILTHFKKKGDILLGTQLIAKGHDIPHVNLVGVLGIDTTLNLPDFRSAEQTFQLLTQVAGRAGRAQKQGEVYIQTHHKDHYVFNHSQNHDSLNFFKEEIQFRNTLHYPPFCTLINIIISSESQKNAHQYSLTLYEKLNQSYPNNKKTIIMPNKPCPFEKIRNHFRFHIVLKCNLKNAQKIKEQLNKLDPPPANIRKIVDFDAWQLL